MKPIRIRYSLSIITISVVVLYFSGNFLVNKFHLWNHRDKFVVVTIDEDKKLSLNSNYAKAVDAFNKKNYTVAVEELKEEINKSPNHAQAYFLLGKIYEDEEIFGKKYYSKMLSCYEKYIELKPKGKRINYIKLRVAQSYVHEGLTQQNIDLIDRAERYLKELDQTDSNVKMALGAIYLDKKNYDQAIFAFEKSTNLPPSELKLKYNSLGLAYIKKGMYANAEKILEIAVRIDPNDKYAHNNLGFVYAQKGRFKDAKTHFTEASRLDPEYKNAKKNLKWVEEELIKKQK